jgi:hypothetical protein
MFVPLATLMWRRYSFSDRHLGRGGLFSLHTTVENFSRRHSALDFVGFKKINALEQKLLRSLVHNIYLNLYVYGNCPLA